MDINMIVVDHRPTWCRYQALNIVVWMIGGWRMRSPTSHDNNGITILEHPALFCQSSSSTPSKQFNRLLVFSGWSLFGRMVDETIARVTSNRVMFLLDAQEVKFWNLIDLYGDSF